MSEDRRLIDPSLPLPRGISRSDLLDLLRHQQRVFNEMAILVDHYSKEYDRVMSYLQIKEK